MTNQYINNDQDCFADIFVTRALYWRLFFGMNIQPYATYCCIISWLIFALIYPLLNKAPALKYIE